MSTWMREIDASARSDVVALLSEQRDLCRQLAQFGQLQRSLITGGESEQLLETLGDRQRLLDRMVVVGERLRSYQRDWPQVRAALPAEEGARADALVAEVNGLLSAILHADEADARLLSARKEATAQELMQVGQGRQAGAAYAAAESAAGPRVEWVE